MNTSVSSISFVITAIYTYTFGNSVYQIVGFNEKAQDIEMRAGTDSVIIICALICMIMALRFFFGNNNYVDEMFSKPSSAVSRLYHFAVVSGESLILLGSSFLVRNPHKFLLWIGILFIVEDVWYIGCLICFRGAVSGDDGTLNKPLLANELANLIMVLGAIAGYTVTSLSQQAIVYIVAALFVVNTAVDLKVNLKGYMGV